MVWGVKLAFRPLDNNVLVTKNSSQAGSSEWDRPVVIDISHRGLTSSVVKKVQLMAVKATAQSIRNFGAKSRQACGID